VPEAPSAEDGAEADGVSGKQKTARSKSNMRGEAAEAPKQKAPSPPPGKAADATKPADAAKGAPKEAPKEAPKAPTAQDASKTPAKEPAKTPAPATKK